MRPSVLPVLGLWKSFSAHKAGSISQKTVPEPFRLDLRLGRLISQVGYFRVERIPGGIVKARAKRNQRIVANYLQNRRLPCAIVAKHMQLTRLMDLFSRAPLWYNAPPKGE
jgi:hypothetical protein